MSPLSLSLLLLMALASLCSHASPTTLEARKPPKITWVYRGDRRDPATVRAAGGFLPRSNPAPANGYSLFSHVYAVCGVGSCKPKTGYVSTTVLKPVARRFSGDRWVYRIHATPNFVDVAASLLDAYPVSVEEEIAAMGGIRWQQVHGWYEVQEAHGEGPVLTEYVNNKDYDVAYDNFAASGGQPQLAGFDAASAYWKRKPWSRFAPEKGKSTMQYALEFMNAHGPPVGWRGRFPLWMSAEDAQAKQLLRVQLQQTAELVAAATDSARREGRRAAEANDFAGAVAAAKRSRDAAAKALALTTTIADIINDNILLDPAPFYAAWASFQEARRASARAYISANKALMHMYAHEEPPSSSSHASAAARQAATKIEAIYHAAQIQLQDKKNAIARLKQLLSAKTLTMSSIMDNKVHWLRQRENISTALHREIRGIDEVVAILTKAMERFHAAAHVAEEMARKLEEQERGEKGEGE
ncbi:putative enterotoxin [Ophiocordyceps australis]|uniref:Putative enterotoxin n=1 Tax=Ophiocordyceps australis TaxID=1399860 RepID=A0A2C5Y453_9HYPO|nr:putative enterotoxin [Ophiocordyceps australis]